MNLGQYEGPNGLRLMPELHVADVAREEREKYAEICQLPEYNAFSPGVENVEWFMETVKPQKMRWLIDIGCGAGKAGLLFKSHGLNVTWLDLVDVRLHEAIDRKHFIKAALWDDWQLRRRIGWDYGYCVDVMEHLPTEFVMLVIDRIIRACQLTWFQIALADEIHGAMIGKPLHLTIRDFVWWRDRLGAVGNLVDARDQYPRGLYIVERR